MKQFNELKTTVAALHAALNVDDHKLKLENSLVKKIEQYKTELRPLEEVYYWFWVKVILSLTADLVKNKNSGFQYL